MTFSFKITLANSHTHLHTNKHTHTHTHTHTESHLIFPGCGALCCVHGRGFPPHHYSISASAACLSVHTASGRNCCCFAFVLQYSFDWLEGQSVILFIYLSVLQTSLNISKTLSSFIKILPVCLMYTEEHGFGAVVALMHRALDL